MSVKRGRNSKLLVRALPVIAVIAALGLLALLSDVLPKEAPAPSVATATNPLPTSTPTSTPTPRPTRTPTSTPSPTPTVTFTPLPPLVHVVASGEVPGTIAKQYGISVEELLAANGLKEGDYIHVGQELIIPRPTPTEQPQTEPSVAPTEESTSTPSVESQPGPAPGERSYSVQQGDTLSDIAKAFGVSVNLLMDRNNIEDPSLLHVGDIIIIPAGTPTPLPTPTFRPTDTPVPGPAYATPALLWPPDGTIYRGVEEPVLVQWAGVGFLARDEWYVVRVRRAADGLIRDLWTKATSYRLPPDLRPAADAASHQLTWQVLIMRLEGFQLGQGKVLVPAGESRWIEWY